MLSEMNALWYGSIVPWPQARNFPSTAEASANHAVSPPGNRAALPHDVCRIPTISAQQESEAVASTNVLNHRQIRRGYQFHVFRLGMLSGLIGQQGTDFRFSKRRSLATVMPIGSRRARWGVHRTVKVQVSSSEAAIYVLAGQESHNA
jgi:hypothetical protein